MCVCVCVSVSVCACAFVRACVCMLFGLSLCSQAIFGNAVTDDDTRMVDDDGTMPKAPEAIDFSRQSYTPPAGSPVQIAVVPFFCSSVCCS